MCVCVCGHLRVSALPREMGVWVKGCGWEWDEGCGITYVVKRLVFGFSCVFVGRREGRKRMERKKDRRRRRKRNKRMGEGEREM